VVSVAVTLRIRIPEAPDSNLRRDTDYSEIFVVFASHSKRMPR
jgi:hypothetical protein